MESSSVARFLGRPASESVMTSLDEELRRLHAKLAFYEHPIERFDEPVCNQPRESDLARVLEREQSVAARWRRLRRRWRRAFQRLVDALMPPQNQKKHEERPWCLRLHKLGLHGKCRHGPVAMVLEARPPPSRRHVTLDEHARFRLGLIGLHVDDDVESV
ncbi:hypothetical protein Poli38472_012269 [Pythium oligandrum]|uniref:Uncharacterized protein n=1 Tax=Pythium oligandrum TaxID=41045 RepID=A0A8K1FR19_PYTOL|nr:hypothetical protein Poli38472_012269 [Pythium oligandrum]|eukprot:TMW67153.1 hypothetical protein Poli38472_012269 [Pythium oligandrum]